MQIFITAVEQGSFAKAAGQYQITPTMVGKHIKMLEAELGTRLLLRTTRKQSLTETGQVYFSKCKQLLGELTLLENQLQAIECKPKGLVKINAPSTLSTQVLSQILAEFLQTYPEIDIELISDNQKIDPISAHYDLLIRVGALQDSDLIARKLGEYKMLYCAAPSYLHEQGTPQQIDELYRHNCLGFLYQKNGQQTKHNMGEHDCRLSSNSGQVLVNLALSGAGIILQPKLLLADLLKEGLLVEVLQQHSPAPEPIHLLYPHKNTPLKVKTLIDFILNKSSTLPV